jgi:hypothetical protein
MKLILKRVGLHHVEKADQNTNPFALHTEDGECLPGQKEAVIHNDHSGPTVTVTFYLNERDVKVQGDD